MRAIESNFGRDRGPRGSSSLLQMDYPKNALVRRKLLKGHLLFREAAEQRSLVEKFLSPFCRLPVNAGLACPPCVLVSGFGDRRRKLIENRLTSPIRPEVCPRGALGRKSRQNAGLRASPTAFGRQGSRPLKAIPARDSVFVCVRVCVSCVVGKIGQKC